jgi:hypothetical protein
MALDKFARSLGMRAPAIARLGAPLIEQVRSSLDGVLDQVAAGYTHHPVLDQIRDLVLQRASLAEGWLALATTKPK